MTQGGRGRRASWRRLGRRGEQGHGRQRPMVELNAGRPLTGHRRVEEGRHVAPPLLPAAASVDHDAGRGGAEGAGGVEARGRSGAGPEAAAGKGGLAGRQSSGRAVALAERRGAGRRRRRRPEEGGGRDREGEQKGRWGVGRALPRGEDDGGWRRAMGGGDRPGGVSLRGWRRGCGCGVRAVLRSCGVRVFRVA